MINIAMRSQGAIDNSSLSSINTVTYDVVQAQTISSLNTRKGHGAVHSPQDLDSSQAQRTQPATHSRQHLDSTQAQRTQTAAHSRQDLDSPQAQRTQSAAHPLPGSGPAHAQSGSTLEQRPVPPLRHVVQKGQKIALEPQGALHTIKACLGWNTTNPQCDIDVSAFLLDSSGKVPGDDWFIFYGQTQSPDRSTIFCPENHLAASAERESITIRLDKLNANVKKIVFVLTIHEAIEKRLHFGMVQDAYIRICNADTKEELVSFKMTEYYSNVISMMIGEVYQHNGIWKFNAVGNGVAKDLSGLCELYGVQVSD